MKHILTKFKNPKVILIASLAVAVFFINSCSGGGDEEPTPDPIPTTTDEMYIKVNGLKVICRLPAKEYDVWVNIGDTGVTWIGNLGFKDTTIDIVHAGPKIAGFKYKFDPTPANITDDIVGTVIRWSSLSTAPYVIVDGGDYTLEKKNGKWVSTLKNGTGYDYNEKTKRYTGIEYRLIWP
jgi:hypothetical protein